jgi:hypothetical protein
MDEKLAKALEFSNLMLTHQTQKNNLKEKFYSSIDFYYNGSKFLATPELISFCTSLLYLDQESAVLIDSNDLPCRVEDLRSFTSDLVDCFKQASNRYINDYNDIKIKKSILDIIND